jgi:hypothetical protein
MPSQRGEAWKLGSGEESVMSTVSVSSIRHAQWGSMDTGYLDSKGNKSKEGRWEGYWCLDRR